MNYEPRTADFEVGYDGNEALKGPQSRRRGLLIALVMVAMALILAAAWYAMRPSKDAKAVAEKGTAAAKSAADDSKQAPRVTTIVPGTRLVENVLTTTGTIAAREDMPVGAVGEGGQVLRVLVQPGVWVQQGQVLAVVDRQVQVQQSAQIAAQINAAQAEARLAQSELDRSQALQSRGFVSKADLQRKAATRDGALARVRVAQAQYAENRARLGRLDIRAPASGYVLERKVEPGQVVGAGAGVLFRIALGGRLEMKAQLSEADLAHMSVGVRASVTPVGTTDVFAGQVFQVSPVINPQTRQGEVRIALPFDKKLRPGGFASAKIIAGSVVAPLLAESAVQSDAKGNYVFVVTPESKVERRDVTVGSINENGVSILTGLTGNEQVVVSAGGFLNPGEKVLPKQMVQAQ